jgi:tetratricopeptide (TPR) repeat protein
MTKGGAFNKLGELEQARQSFAEAIALYESLGDLGGLAEALRGDAMALQAQGKVADAEPLLNREVEIGLKMNHTRALRETYIARSNVMRALGKLTIAKNDAEAALQHARSAQHQSAIARSLTALGSVLAAQGDYSLARGHLEEAERISRAIGEPATASTAAGEIAKLRAAQNRVPTSTHTSLR